MDSETWTIDDSERLYRISDWGTPYFSINAAGHVVVSPQGERGGSLDLYELVLALRKRHLGLPLLIRFPDILQDRIDRLNSAFARAITRYGYAGVYRGVFPVKVNQQRHLVESLVEFGRPHHYGLEAGSKPELLIALANLDTPGALLVCNGYKDREYMETAVLAQGLGKEVLIVLEQLDEVRMAIRVARDLGVRPMFGFRAKLTNKAEGHWGNTVGARAKFGLSVVELVKAVALLREAGMLDCLRLLHYHIGSQISSIGVIKNGLREAGRIYVELTRMGAPMGFLDVGGGLAVDYDGSRSKFYASKNYNTQAYANDVVAEIGDACRLAGINVPTLISESGRAVASHQAVLVFDVLGCNAVAAEPIPPMPENSHHILRTLYEIYTGIEPDNIQEAYNDVAQYKEEAASAFQHGILSLSERALADALYWASCARIRDLSRGMEAVPDEIKALDQVLSATYYVNMSIFQSCPDSWAIKQLFPVLPIHRLAEEPQVRATLADLTCDSDGKIDTFIDLREDVKSLLEVHALVPLGAAVGDAGLPAGSAAGLFAGSAAGDVSGVTGADGEDTRDAAAVAASASLEATVTLAPTSTDSAVSSAAPGVTVAPTSMAPSAVTASLFGDACPEHESAAPGRAQHEPYYLGMFLSGAYQETMGNLHNLFGDTNAVHIRLTPQGYQVQHVVRGDTNGDVLSYMEYKGSDLLECLRQQCERALGEGSITLEESQRLLDNFEDSLGKYTYFS